MVLIDFGLPDVCGITVIERVKQVCPECDVLVVTSFSGQPTIKKLVEHKDLRHHHCASKPGNLLQLPESEIAGIKPTIKLLATSMTRKEPQEIVAWLELMRR
jgi:DNA-binding NtrC family response regulator